MACRNSHVITKPTLTAVAAASWTFARCFGKTGGPSRATTSPEARLKSNLSAAAMPWNWVWKLSRSPPAVADLGDAADPEVAVVRLAVPIRWVEPMRGVDAVRAATADP